MTVEPMDCTAPERGLMPFLAAGTLIEAERAAASAHARDCPVCTAELSAVRELLEGLRSTHLTPDEIVEAAESGEALAHLDVCSSCRGERDALREVNAALNRRELGPSLGRRPELAWAAALVLSVPAGLFVLGALRGRPPADPGAKRGPEPTARVVVPQTVVLSAQHPNVVPPATIVIEFDLPARPPGQRIEAELVDGRGVTLWAGAIPDDAERGRLVLDARGLTSGATLEVRRVDAAGVDREHVVYAIAPGRP